MTRVGLEPDVAEQFPTEESVNDALRQYIKITKYFHNSSYSLVYESFQLVIDIVCQIILIEIFKNEL